MCQKVFAVMVSKELRSLQMCTSVPCTSMVLSVADLSKHIAETESIETSAKGLLWSLACCECKWKGCCVAYVVLAPVTDTARPYLLRYSFHTNMESKGSAGASAVRFACSVLARLYV